MSGEVVWLIFDARLRHIVQLKRLIGPLMLISLLKFICLIIQVSGNKHHFQLSKTFDSPFSLISISKSADSYLKSFLSYTLQKQAHNILTFSNNFLKSYSLRSHIFCLLNFQFYQIFSMVKCEFSTFQPTVSIFLSPIAWLLNQNHTCHICCYRTLFLVRISLLSWVNKESSYNKDL